MCCHICTAGQDKHGRDSESPGGREGPPSKKTTSDPNGSARGAEIEKILREYFDVKKHETKVADKVRGLANYLCDAHLARIALLQAAKDSTDALSLLPKAIEINRRRESRAQFERDFVLTDEDKQLAFESLEKRFKVTKQDFDTIMFKFEHLSFSKFRPSWNLIAKRSSKGGYEKLLDALAQLSSEIRTILEDRQVAAIVEKTPKVNGNEASWHVHPLRQKYFADRL